MRPHGFRPTFVEDIQRFYFPRMGLRHPVRRLSVDERLERAASVANLAMLRTYTEPSHIQIQTINWLAFLLESDLRSLPPDDTLIRQRVLNQLAILRSKLAPIRRLPDEILSDIFSRVAKKSPLRALQAAITISHVCSTWRRVARGHAALWTTVIVETVEDFDDYTELFLPLTKDVPLELRCDNHKDLGNLWDRIAPYRSRWRRITLGAHLGTLPALQVLHMERLERLVIFAYDAPISTNLSVLDFVVAPRLGHIGLTLDELRSERQLHVPVTRALTSVMIEAMEPFSVTRVFPLLQECANTLQFLTLKIRHPRDQPEGSCPVSASVMFSMTALTELRVNDSICALLNHITAPLIQELVLSAVPVYGSRTLLGFLTRNQPSRHLMDFRVYQTEEQDVSAWIPCLELMPSVEDLHFDELLSNEDFLKLLIRHEDRPPILPSLKRISMINIYYKHRELRPLIREMCNSRTTITTYRGNVAVIPLTWFGD